MRRCALTVLVSLAVFATLAPAAAARSNYYGFNYLNPDIPTECKPAWGKGCAQHGFNNWDWSGMEKSSGDCVYIGFRDTSGTFYFNTAVTYCSEWNGSNFHVSRGGGPPYYNRTFCAYFVESQTYAQCWAEIF